MRVAIVTDSTADLDPNVAAELGVEVVPLYVNFGERSFRDRIDITREEFYTRLASDSALPTTSQAPTAVYAEFFAAHAASGAEVVCLSISSSLSGTINAATAAAAQFPQAKIRIFDSRTVSAGLMLLVLEAVKLAGQDKGADEIVAALETQRAHQHLFAAIPDLSHAVRTGRISKAMAMIGGIMKISPVITLDDAGKVAEYARVRTFGRALDTLVDATVAHIEDPNATRVAIVHAHAPDTAVALRDRLIAKLPQAPQRLDVIETGPAISVHAGIGAAGIFSLS